jgi:hypothetical protein
VRNASNYLTFDSVEPPLDISTEVFQFQLQKKVLQPFLNGIIYCFYLSMVVKGMKIILNFLLIAAVEILVKM